MNSFISGAISALNHVLRTCEILDPENENKHIQTIKNQILIFKEEYLIIDKVRTADPLFDSTWEKITKACADLDIELESGQIFDKTHEA